MGLIKEEAHDVMARVTWSCMHVETAHVPCQMTHPTHLLMIFHQKNRMPLKVDWFLTYHCIKYARIRVFTASLKCLRYCDCKYNSCLAFVIS